MDTQQRFNQLDLNLLRVLREVYIQRQLSLAADHLALSASAVSHALRRLRDYFDDPLFERHGRRLVPTALCASIAPTLVEHLDAMQTLFASPQSFNPHQAQVTFKLGMPDALEATLLPALHHYIQTQAPHCQLRSVPFVREQASELLARRELDVIIDVARPVASPVQHQRLIQDKLMILSAQPVTLHSATQYIEQQHIAVSGRAHGIVLEDISFLQAGIERDIVMRCQSYQSAAQIVAQSQLCLTAPSSVAVRLAAQYQLHLQALPFTQPAIDLHLYWHQRDHDNPANVWLRQTLVDIARD
ncbi:MAG: LysR family transcriptional regulator [Idiomarina sp.]|nr:LysR family transcriptional regulator [Idiomarina sp.]